MKSRIAFIECGGNSQALNAPQAQPLNVPGLHGLVVARNGPVCGSPLCLMRRASNRARNG